MKDRVGDGKLIKIMASPPPPQVFGCGAIAPMKSAPRGDWQGGENVMHSRARVPSLITLSHACGPRSRGIPPSAILAPRKRLSVPPINGISGLHDAANSASIVVVRETHNSVLGLLSVGFIDSACYHGRPHIGANGVS